MNDGSIVFFVNRKRIFVLTTEFPWPANSGGRVRTVAELRLLAELEEVSKVTIFSLAESEIAESLRSQFDAQHPKWDVLSPVFHPIHLKQFPAYMPRVALLRGRGTPYLAGKWDHPHIREELRRALSGQAPDIVYVDHLGMMQYAPMLRALLPRARLVLEQHNVESEFFSQFAKSKRGVSSLIARAEARLAERFETWALQEADSVVAISEGDSETFFRMARIRAMYVPQTVLARDDRAYNPAPNRVLYVGNLSWHPNVAGLDWFFENVWAKAREKNPSLTIHVIGGGLAKGKDGAVIVPAKWQQEGVLVKGFVDDLADEYQRAQVLVAPVFGGSGVRIKLLEGMGMGVPIVTTSDGAKGLAVENGCELVVADTADEFAAAMDAITSSHARGKALREAAFRYVIAKHSERVAKQKLAETLFS